MASISELQAQKRKLNASLAEIRLKAKRIKHNTSRQHRTIKRAWILDDKCLKTVLAVYIVSDSSCEAAVAYLKKLGRQRRWGVKKDSELEVMVLHAVLAADFNILATFADPDAAQETIVMRAAIEFTTQWRLVAWCKEQNQKGIAPRTSLMLDRWEHLRTGAPVHVRPKRWGVSAAASARMRIFRLRRSFHGRVGKFRIRERLPVDVMQFKVGHTSSLVRQLSRLPRCPPIRPPELCNADAAPMPARLQCILSSGCALARFGVVPTLPNGRSARTQPKLWRQTGELRR